MADMVGLLSSIVQLADTVAQAGIHLKNFQNASKERKQLFGELDTLRPLLTDLQRHISIPHSAESQKLDPEMKISGAKKFTKHLAWALWDKEQAKDDLNKIERFKLLLTNWLNMNLLDMAKKKEKEAIVEWFSPINFFPRQQTILANRQEGTRTWLANHPKFKQWGSGFGEKLWCYGIPGAGKTVLVSVIVEILQNQYANLEDITTAYIYCSHQETGIQTPSNLLASIWRQLNLNHPMTIDITSLYEYHHRQGTRPPHEEILAILQSTIARYSKVFIIVDALDECPEDGHTRDILLNNLLQLGPHVNLMLTSRPHVDISATLGDFEALEIRGTREDIQKFVDAQIFLSSRLKRHVTAREELLLEISDCVLDKANGMFLFAKLYIDALAKKTTVRAVRDALENFPADLNGLYDSTMLRIESQTTDDRNLALKALAWISYAIRPLSVTELQQALAVSPEDTELDCDNITDVDVIVSVCAGLIEIGHEHDVRLIHFTTQHYLNEVYARQFAQAHTEIATICLTYLSFTSFSNIEIPTESHLQKLLDIHPLLEYAGKYWSSHAQQDPEFHMKAIILKFLENQSRRKFCMSLLDCDKNSWFNPTAFHHTSRMWISARLNLSKLACCLPEEASDDCHPLYVASYYGHTDMVAFLLEKGVDVDVQGGCHGFPLQAAAIRGHLDVVELLLKKGADVNALGGYWGTALQAMICGRDKNHRGIVQLLSNGAEVIIPGGHHGNSLQAAAFQGYIDITQILLNRGADINAEGGFYGSALQAASFSGHFDLVNLLLKSGADANIQGGYYGNPLQAACLEGHVNVVQLLLEKGAIITGQGGYPGNPLQAASLSGSMDLVRLLVKNGADIDSQGGEYGSTLQAASFEGHLNIVDLLLKMNAEINTPGGKYGTALWAASERGHFCVVNLLLQNGAQLDTGGRSALQTAAYHGHINVVDLLLQNGADVNAGVAEDSTALFVACKKGHIDIVTLLLKQNINIKAQGQAALQIASLEGHIDVVQELLDNGVDVNISGGWYDTALQAASAGNHIDLVKFLLNRGADINAQGGIYDNALHAASYCGHAELEKLLIELGANSTVNHDLDL
ncbi:ankyrin repeat-containing domain protein [Mycena latifolia]|nr:ankyrin repeat-containing domain protein [Mycena latifolia]